MKPLTHIALLGLALLGGCASTIRSDVTTFHQWPAEMPDKSYILDAPPAPDDTLEYRSYQNLLRAELAKLGFVDAGPGGKPALAVAMRFSTTDQPVKVIQMDEPMFYPAVGFRHGWPYRHPYFGWYGMWGPYYDPFLYGPPDYRVTIQHNYQRELKVSITSIAGGAHLFDVTVHNLSRQPTSAAVMPALIHSAFVNFPGPNGVPQRVELKQQ